VLGSYLRYRMAMDCEEKIDSGEIDLIVASKSLEKESEFSCNCPWAKDYECRSNLNSIGYFEGKNLD
jgi:hypothetical protein